LTTECFEPCLNGQITADGVGDKQGNCRRGDGLHETERITWRRGAPITAIGGFPDDALGQGRKIEQGDSNLGWWKKARAHHRFGMIDSAVAFQSQKLQLQGAGVGRWPLEQADGQGGSRCENAVDRDQVGQEACRALAAGGPSNAPTREGVALTGLAMDGHRFNEQADQRSERNSQKGFQHDEG